MSANAAPQRFDVIISGASFAGLALARAMASSLGPGIRIALIDPAPAAADTKQDCRASALSASSKRMLDVLGIWSRIAGDAEPVLKIDITDSSLEAGIRPVLLTYENRVDQDEPASFIVPNAALHAALAEAVAGDPAVTRLARAAAKDFSADETSVSVGLDDGRALTAALLVAADGRRSSLRDAAGIKVVRWAHPQTGIVTVVAHDRPHRGTAVQHFLPAGPFAILPLKGNRSCITWTEDAEEAQRILALDDAAFLAELEKRFGGKLSRLRLDGARQSWPLETHLARRYIAPRFALIGDAAHGVHPIAGQGLNLALRDAAALTEVVTDSARLGLDLGNWEALQRYERWRRFDSAVSAFVFDGLNRLFAGDAPLVRAGREFGLGVVDRLSGLKGFFVTEAAGLSGELPRLLRGERV